VSFIVVIFISQSIKKYLKIDNRCHGNSQPHHNDHECCAFVQISLASCYEDLLSCLEGISLPFLFPLIMLKTCHYLFKSLECNSNVFFFNDERYPRNRLWGIEIGHPEKPTEIPSSGSSGWQFCEVHLNSSWYLGCDGKKLTSSQYLSKMKELFAFTNVSVNDWKYQRISWQSALKVCTCQIICRARLFGHG